MSEVNALTSQDQGSSRRNTMRLLIRSAVQEAAICFTRWSDRMGYQSLSATIHPHRREFPSTRDGKPFGIRSSHGLRYRHRTKDRSAFRAQEAFVATSA